MKTQELIRKVRNYEILATHAATMGSDERAALRDEVVELHESIRPSRTMTRYALGGAAAGAVLPVLGLLTGGAAGALWGAVRAHDGPVADARQRLEQLITLLS